MSLRVRDMVKGKGLTFPWRRAKTVNNRELLAAAQTEMVKHNWDFFVDDRPAMAQGGKGAVVPGLLALQEAIEYDNAIS